MPVFTYSFTPQSCELKRKPKVEQPKKRKRRQTKKRRTEPTKPRRRRTVRRHNTAASAVQAIVPVPRYIRDDTLQETWVCDVEGVCRLVKKQHIVNSPDTRIKKHTV